MRIALLTREYPPEVYGGAGVHVEYLARELNRHAEVTVHCFGADRPPRQRPHAVAHQPDPAVPPGLAALRTVSVDVAMAAALAADPPDVVHSHTWYANLAGHLAALQLDRPHIVTTHSLEPLRPWKAEQLAGGYAVSCWAERTGIEAAAAVVAVSEGMRRDVLESYPAVDPDRVHVIHNGVDTTVYAPDPATDVLARYAVDPDRPTVVFVGRITRQKGVGHLLDAARLLPPEAQVVLCAGAPDTPEIGAEVAAQVAALSAERHGVVWVRGMLAVPEVVQLLTHATVFVCPSVYEPLGIVNLEAMACGTAVVATATGGIPEVVADGETGLLVPFTPAGGGLLGPADPEVFAHDLAERLTALLKDPGRAAAYGAAGRRRAVEHFGWPEVARRTLDLYQMLTG